MSAGNSPSTFHAFSTKLPHFEPTEPSLPKVSKTSWPWMVGMVFWSENCLSHSPAVTRPRVGSCNFLNKSGEALDSFPSTEKYLSIIPVTPSA